MNTQATGDFPTFFASSYGNATTCALLPENWTTGGDLEFNVSTGEVAHGQVATNPIVRRIVPFHNPFQIPDPPTTPLMATKRIVRVYLADTDDNIPVERTLLHQGEEKFTDLTDQELYFEIPVKDLLAEHNNYRKTLVNKKATQAMGKEVMLEPIKIRDLKMLVVTVASFT